MKKGDKFWIGLILGIVAPFLGIYIFYLWKASANPFDVFISTLLTEKRYLTTVVSFSLVINAIIFTICVNTRRDKTAKGLFIVTVLYAITALIYKFVN